MHTNEWHNKYEEIPADHTIHSFNVWLHYSRDVFALSDSRGRESQHNNNSGFQRGKFYLKDHRTIRRQWV